MTRELDLWRMVEDATRTFGRIETQEREQLGVTVERPWVDADHNGKRDRNVSCVIAGRFLCKRVDSPKHGDCFELQNVPDCDHSQIHVACLPRDLQGCIGIGTAFGPVQYPDMAKPEPGVIHSRDALKHFMQRMAGVNEFWLTIHDVPKASA